MPERVVRYVTSRQYGSQLLDPRGRSLYPPVRRRPRGPDEPVDLADVAELQGAGESSVQLGMGRNDTRLAALPLPDPDGGPVDVQRQDPRLDRQRLRDPQSGPPLDQEQQQRPWIRSGPDQRVDLVAFRYSGS